MWDSPTLRIATRELWAAQVEGDKLFRVDTATGQFQAFTVGGALVAVLSHDDSIWVTDSRNNQVIRVDPNTGQVTRRIDVGTKPWGLAAGGGAIWVVNRGNATDRVSTVSRVDPNTNRVTKTITVGAGADGVAWMDGALWVASETAGEVTRITG